MSLVSTADASRDKGLDRREPMARQSSWTNMEAIEAKLSKISAEDFTAILTEMTGPGRKKKASETIHKEVKRRQLSPRKVIDTDITMYLL